MARTADPGAATKKAWLTRKRNEDAAAGIHARAQEGGGGTAVQQRGDFRAAGSTGKASIDSIAGLIHHSEGLWFRSDQRRPPSKTERENQVKAESYIRKGLADVEIPAAALDGLQDIQITTEREMGMADGVRLAGDYSGATKQVRINADYVGRKIDAAEAAAAGGSVFAVRDTREAATKTVSHEIGHHVHLSKLGAAAALEWQRLSRGGASCQMSAYGRTNTAEHFAEAFASYSRPGAGGGGFNRQRLRALEPRTYAFMERLWSDQSMWQPKGQAEYYWQRRGDPTAHDPFGT